NLSRAVGNCAYFAKAPNNPLWPGSNEANEHRMVIVVKNQQVAVPRDEIDRIDYRAPNSGTKATKETRTKRADPNAGASRVGMPSEQGKVNVPGGGSSSTAVTFGSKGEFETVYRRPEPRSGAHVITK